MMARTIFRLSISSRSLQGCPLGPTVPNPIDHFYLIRASSVTIVLLHGKDSFAHEFPKKLASSRNASFSHSKGFCQL